ncbi:MAG: ROK family protein, partial [Lachnospiraceae bacterium]
KQLISEGNRKSLLENFENLTAKDVFDCAKSGDLIALEATEVLGKYLAMVMATVTLTVDPDVFVIGGGVSKAGTFLLDLIRKNFEKSVTISSEIPCIRLAELGNDAGIYGAARMALQ